MPPLCRSCPALWLGPSPLPTPTSAWKRMLLPHPEKAAGCALLTRATCSLLPSSHLLTYYRIDKQRKALLLPGVRLPKASCCEGESQFWTEVITTAGPRTRPAPVACDGHYSEAVEPRQQALVATGFPSQTAKDRMRKLFGNSPEVHTGTHFVPRNPDTTEYNRNDLNTPTLIEWHHTLPISLSKHQPSHVLKPLVSGILCLIHFHDNNAPNCGGQDVRLLSLVRAESRDCFAPKLVRTQAPFACLAAVLVLLGKAQGVTSTNCHLETNPSRWL